MKTRILQIDRERPDAATIDEAASAIKAGKLVVFPTETVYGLGAHALDPDAVQKIFDAKERPANDPLIVHIANVGQVNQCAIGMPAAARTLAQFLWPGPLTLILQKQLIVPGLVTAGLDSVAVRVPSHRVAHALMEAAGVPIAAPSANRFSRPSPTTAAHVLEDLDGRVDLILDAGPTDIGLESTIVDFTVDPPTIRRPGGITFEHIQSLVPDVIIASQRGRDDQPQVAPGQLTRHYAPKADLFLYEGPPDAVRRRVAADLRAITASGHRAGVLAPEEDLLALAPEIAARASAGRIESIPYGSRDDLERSARELYASIRAIDATGVAKILAIGVGSDGLARAIHDRLMRAADGRIRSVV